MINLCSIKCDTSLELSAQVDLKSDDDNKNNNKNNDDKTTTGKMYFVLSNKFSCQPDHGL